jgi:NADP-dependent 3-hydroxy-3-methylglutaryl-CoA reductase
MKNTEILFKAQDDGQKPDRRSYNRLQVRDGFRVQAGLRIKGQFEMFDAYDFSEDGLSIAVSKEFLDFFKESSDYTNVAVYVNDILRNTVNLKLLRVWLDKEKDIAYVGFTKMDDEATSAALWEISYNYIFAKKTEMEHFRIDPEKLPRVPGRGEYTEEARQERLGFVREKTGAALERVQHTSFDPQKLTGNIEGFIGSIEIPVGIAGPMIIHGRDAYGVFYAPLATTEGALVASIGRGAIAISKSGGATAHVLQQRMMRVPLFSFFHMEAALFFAEWIRTHNREIKREIRKYSNFANLVELRPFVNGRDVHVYFVYETGDAAGQNMTTTCTWNTCKWILKQMQYFKEIEIQRFIIDGGLSNDKRVTYQSFIRGRGIRVVAEVFIPEDVLMSVLKVTPDQLMETYNSGVAGCIQAGMIGVNVNVANVIAAIFTSTGQDIASVHESALAHFHIERSNNGLYASMMLPSLVIGTVGGGTSLGHQKECLEILGCAGSGNSHKLAEIIASFCLALDLSTLSAIASGQFASAHERLGRNRPVNIFKITDINEQFLTEIMRLHSGDKNIYVTEIEALNAEDLGSSIITRLTSNHISKPLGLFPYIVEFDSSAGKRKIEMMIKIKPMDIEVNHMHHTLGLMCDARLAAEVKKSQGKTGVTMCHVRELEIYKQTDPRFTSYVPEIYGVYRNDAREAYIIIQERLKDLELMDTADDISGFNEEYIKRAIDGIAEIHSIWYKREDELKKKEWIGDYPTKDLMISLTSLWKLLTSHMRSEFPEWISDIEYDMIIGRIDSMDSWWGRIEAMPKTLIHNDFNPRNIGYRKTENGPKVCIYDWELATIHLPQHDLAEFLIFVLDENTTREELLKYTEYHRLALEKASGEKIDAAEWWDGFRCSMWDLLINRISMYAMAHTIRNYVFMNRIHNTIRKMLDIVRPG